ncbi:MAG: hypothetical protein RIE77_08025 [Phycisphaerales bacterium]|jgi:hypothetical protein
MPTTQENAIFHETQRLHQNSIVRYLVPISTLSSVVLVLAIMIGSGQSASTLALVVVLGLGLPLLLMQLPMRTTVTEREIRVRALVFFRFVVAIEQVRDARAITYNPLMDCGGWGVRISRKFGWVLNVSGDRGVHVHYTAGDKDKSMLIGSLRSDELERAIRLAADLPDAELSQDAAGHDGAPPIDA